MADIDNDGLNIILGGVAHDAAHGASREQVETTLSFDLRDADADLTPLQSDNVRTFVDDIFGADEEFPQ